MSGGEVQYSVLSPYRRRYEDDEGFTSARRSDKPFKFGLSQRQVDGIFETSFGRQN